MRSSQSSSQAGKRAARLHTKACQAEPGLEKNVVSQVRNFYLYAFLTARIEAVQKKRGLNRTNRCRPRTYVRLSSDYAASYHSYGSGHSSSSSHVSANTAKSMKLTALEPCGSASYNSAGDGTGM